MNCKIRVKFWSAIFAFFESFLRTFLKRLQFVTICHFQCNNEKSQQLRWLSLLSG